jgi:hypothetical protein
MKNNGRPNYMCKSLKEGWRKTHNAELYNLYSSPSIVRIVKSRRIRRMEHATRMDKMQNCSPETWTEQTFWETYAWAGG